MDTYGDRKPEFIPCATRQFTYDAENHLVNTASVTYTYDGDGKRVQKSNGTLYWYGTSSEPIAETNASGNTTNEYIFFGGKRVALVAAGTSPVYYAQDILGTSRVITNSAGSICYDADYYPYGGERAVTNTCPQNYKFTGKERDPESGLAMRQNSHRLFSIPYTLFSIRNVTHPLSFVNAANSLPKTPGGGGPATLSKSCSLQPQLNQHLSSMYPPTPLESYCFTNRVGGGSSGTGTPACAVLACAGPSLTPYFVTSSLRICRPAFSSIGAISGFCMNIFHTSPVR